MIKELSRFFVYNDLLLYASKEFIGYDPIISVPLMMSEYPLAQKKKTEHTFVINDELFHVIHSICSFQPPTRYAGYHPPPEYLRHIEVKRNNQLIISITTPVDPFADPQPNRGQDYFIEGDTAYIIVTGSDLTDRKTDSVYRHLASFGYYLLVFHKVSLPVVFPLKVIKPSERKELYSKEDLEPLRQVLWRGTLQLPMDLLKVGCSEVPGFGWKSQSGGITMFEECDECCLNKKELIIRGKKFVFENSY